MLRWRIWAGRSSWQQSRGFWVPWYTSAQNSGTAGTYTRSPKVAILNCRSPRAPRFILPIRTMYAAPGGSFKARQGITSKKKFILLETFRLLILNLIARHLDQLFFLYVPDFI